MKVAPIRKYEEPRFPTKSVLNDHPELLHMIPKRWQRNSVVLSALAGVCILASGCKWNGHSTTHAPLLGSPMPTKLITEDEALNVIISEVKRAGVSFDTDSLTVEVTKPSYSTQYQAGMKVIFFVDGKEKKEKVSYEVFYDRAPYQNELEKEKLRSQVKSFLEWLKTEGII